MSEYKTTLTKRDLDVLETVYRLQAVRAIDITDAYFTGYGYGMARLQRLVERGYMERSYTVTSHGRRNHAVLNIADRGIEILINTGRLTPDRNRRARDFKLTGWDMLRRVEISKICIHLAKAGWRFMNSRDAKEEYRLNPNSIMHCCIISPDNDLYQVYHVGRSMKEITLNKLLLELGGNKYGSLVLYETNDPLEKTPAYTDIMREIDNQGIFVNELCMIPLVNFHTEAGSTSLAVTMLKNSTAKHVWTYLRNKYGFVGYLTNRYGFGTMYVKIENNGEEKDHIICNYLRRNKTALRMLSRNLTTNEHINSGYGAIVLTWQGFKNETQEEIDRLQPGRDFITTLPVLSKDLELPDDKRELELMVFNGRDAAPPEKNERPFKTAKPGKTAIPSSQ